MKKKTLFFIVLIFQLIMAINSAAEEKKLTDNEIFYKAMMDDKTDQMINMLKKGHNPNKMAHPGSPFTSMWIDRNPLWIADYERAVILLQYGANVRLRPYVADKIIRFANIETEKYPRQFGNKMGNNMTEEYVIKRIKILLDAGADVNAKATPWNDVLLPDTNWNHWRIFNKKGHTALNEAISINAFKLVDFLISYGAKFDNDTSEYMQKATETSGSTEMADYITKLMKEQSNAASDKK